MRTGAALTKGAVALRKAVRAQRRHATKTRPAARRAKKLANVLTILSRRMSTLEPSHKATVIDLREAVEHLTSWDRTRARKLSALVHEVQQAIGTLEDAVALVRSERLAEKNEHQLEGRSVAGNQKSTESGVARWVTEEELKLPLLCTPLMLPEKH